MRRTGLILAIMGALALETRGLSTTRGEDAAPWLAPVQSIETPPPIEPIWQAEPAMITRSPRKVLVDVLPIPTLFPELVLEPPRHWGYGNPLSGTSWRNRPWRAGWFVGGVFGNDLIADEIGQSDDLIGGYHLGYDVDHLWGWETRFAFAKVSLEDGNAPSRLGSARQWYFDGNFQLYPWGDAQWRPFLSAGIGAADFRFADATGAEYRETLFQLPLGMGVKYLARPWLALRIEAMHYLPLDHGNLDAVNNTTATAGVEVHFGGQRKSYYPW